VRYRPAKRATVKVTSAFHHSSYVAKVYHDSTKAAAVAGEAWALGKVATGHGTLRFAPPVAYLPELTVVVQAFVEGTPLDGLLSGGTAAASVASAIRQAAQAMVDLHGYPLVSERQRSVTKELSRFVQRADRVASVDAQLGGDLLRLANRLLDTDAELPPGPIGLVHGDCKPSQFLLSTQSVTLLDLDHCGISQQATDIGTFTASLRQLAVRSAVAGRTRDRNGLEGLARLFTDTYLGSRSAPGLRSRIRWHEAAALQRKALRAFSRAPRSPLPAALVLEGNRCLDQLSRGQT
jgi:aminoglycoside phosphotransferase (APT) family kinase protein